MTNREWLLNEMQNMSDEEISYILKNPCTIFANVEDCGETKNRLGTNILTCGVCAVEWLKAEYKKEVKLTETERTILENIDKDYKWITRDKDGTLYVFEFEPYRDTAYDSWDENDDGKMEKLDIFNHLFQFITWEDKEPYNIEELLTEAGTEN